MKNVAILLLFLTIPIIAAPNWVPPQKAEAFDRIIKDSERLEAILRADYQVVACDLDSDTVKIIIKRHDLFGELFLNLKGENCSFKDNTFSVTLKPEKFTWKEIIISSLISILAGFAAGASL